MKNGVSQPSIAYFFIESKIRRFGRHQGVYWCSKEGSKTFLRHLAVSWWFSLLKSFNFSKIHLKNCDLKLKSIFSYSSGAIQKRFPPPHFKNSFLKARRAANKAGKDASSSRKKSKWWGFCRIQPFWFYCCRCFAWFSSPNEKVTQFDFSVVPDSAQFTGLIYRITTFLKLVSFYYSIKIRDKQMDLNFCSFQLHVSFWLVC